MKHLSGLRNADFTCITNPSQKNTKLRRRASATKQLTCDNQRNSGRNFAKFVADDNLITAGVRNNRVGNRQTRSIGLVDRGVDFRLEMFTLLDDDALSVPDYLRNS
jgi:hypothetical protein